MPISNVTLNQRVLTKPCIHTVLASLGLLVPINYLVDKIDPLLERVILTYLEVEESLLFNLFLNI